MINLYLKPINQFTNLELALKQLPDNLQYRICQKKQKKRQNSSIAGYSLLQSILKDQFGMGLDKLQFLEAGKPILEDTPITFSISHSSVLLGVAISEEEKIGLDIEGFRFFNDISVAFPFFSKEEQAALSQANNPQRQLIDFWSKKEALVKAVGGRMFDMAAYTDVSKMSTIWLEESYFFHSVEPYLDQIIWIVSSLSAPKIKTFLL
jgi:phosphopantetheinyl transferase